MTYHRVCNKGNTMGAASEPGPAYLSGAHEFTAGFSGVRVARFLVSHVMFCKSLFALLSFGHCAVCSSIYDF